MYMIVSATIAGATAATLGGIALMLHDRSGAILAALRGTATATRRPVQPAYA